jgi:hypothetical protein
MSIDVFVGKRFYNFETYFGYGCSNEASLGDSLREYNWINGLMIDSLCLLTGIYRV